MILTGRNKKNLKLMGESLKEGGICIMVCDTIYGLIGKAPDTEQKIRDIKDRSDDKPFLQLVSSKKELKKLTDQDIPKEIFKLWPGPLTLIVRNLDGGTTAYRVPNDPYLKKIIKLADTPIYSTSVNISGEPSQWKIDTIKSHYNDKVDFILDDGDIPGRQPSTLLDISCTPYRLLRKGELKLSEELVTKFNIQTQ